jgi:hypothetical protein
MGPQFGKQIIPVRSKYDPATNRNVLETFLDIGFQEFWIPARRFFRNFAA